MLAFAAAVLLIVGAGCLGDAPHDNPLDPRSDDFEDEGAVVGRVVTRADVPLPGAEVRLVPPAEVSLPALSTSTDGQGRFRFAGAPAASGYAIEVDMEGFSEAALGEIAVEAGREQTLDPLRLNALPAFEEVALRTVHVSRWWPETDVFFLEVDAAVIDADGLNDVAEVRFEVPALGFGVALESLGGGHYNRTVEADSLPARNLEALIGEALRLTVADQTGAEEEIAPPLTRVIDVTPVALDPQGLETVATGQPVFAWEPAPVSFPFTYRLDVFRDDANRAVRVATVAAIAPSTTSTAAPEVLPQGTYFWTISVVDAFGNRSRSKEAGFRIP